MLATKSETIQQKKQKEKLLKQSSKPSLYNTPKPQENIHQKQRPHKYRHAFADSVSMC